MADEQQSDEQFELPDPRKDPRIQELLQRERQLLGEFAELNKRRRPDEPVYELPDVLVLESRIDAMASILVRLGLIDYVEFSGEALVREVEGIEKLLVAAREDKRRRSGGLILPPHRNGTE